MPGVAAGDDGHLALECHAAPSEECSVTLRIAGSGVLTPWRVIHRRIAGAEGVRYSNSGGAAAHRGLDATG